MSNELIINSTPEGARVAILENKRLIEYHIEKHTHKFNVGDVYLGVVKKVSSGLNAAFVDVGFTKDGFLHYLDLGVHFTSLQFYVKEVLEKRNVSFEKIKPQTSLEKFGKITAVFPSNNMPVLVQVAKEPISTKGPRLTCDISIAGRYVVLVPFGNSINISKKISNKAERTRLQKIVSSIKSNNYGVIVRTVAENKEVEELEKDLLYTIEIWENGIKSLANAHPKDRIIGEISRTSSILRDMLNASFDSIVVDNSSVFEEIKQYIHTIAPEKEKILKIHTGKNKIFEHFSIEKQIKTLFGRTVSMPGGGYLIIEHTEALHVIDVNSGNQSLGEENQESTAFRVNIEAAKEIARQIRLRDLGGIIIVDFIDMKKAENRKEIYDIIREEMTLDRSKYTILPITKFGLLQITRQRVRSERSIETIENCPTCNGTGNISATLAITDVIENSVDYLFSRHNERNISIVLHPYLYAFFRSGIWSRQVQWFWKYKKWVKLVQDSSFGITHFVFLNKNQEIIETHD